ncbi:MAG: iron-containing alcohol dehydrogenase, partial [Bryobacterales bacterium]|nr:iron-containing alcohol dehydrogenase [Bryobacterales bacterium]
APVGGAFDAPHGAVCAALLPFAMEVNVRALRVRGGEALDRYAEVARILTGRPDAAPEDGIQWVAGVCRTLRIPPLRAYGIQPGDVAALVKSAAQASSMKGNPVALTTDEMAEILTRAI